MAMKVADMFVMLAALVPWVQRILAPSGAGVPAAAVCAATLLGLISRASVRVPYRGVLAVLASVVPAVSLALVARAPCGHLVLQLVGIAAFCAHVVEVDATLRETEELLGISAPKCFPRWPSWLSTGPKFPRFAKLGGCGKSY